MSTLTLEHEPSITNINIHDSILSIELDDERTVSIPLSWYPRLQNATTDELNDWQIIGHGYGIAWEKIDEHISINGILAGRKSGESPASFEKWLANRKQ